MNQEQTKYYLIPLHQQTREEFFKTEFENGSYNKDSLVATIEGKEYDVEQVVINGENFLIKGHEIVICTPIEHEKHSHEKGIYRFRFESGRMGSLFGIFVADKRDVDLLVNSKMEVYFGEVLGKHSEVCGPVEEREIELVTDDPTVIESFEKFNMATGYNPFNYSAMGESYTVKEAIDKLRTK